MAVCKEKGWNTYKNKPLQMYKLTCKYIPEIIICQIAGGRSAKSFENYNFTDKGIMSVYSKLFRKNLSDSKMTSFDDFGWMKYLSGRDSNFSVFIKNGLSDLQLLILKFLTYWKNVTPSILQKCVLNMTDA